MAIPAAMASAAAIASSSSENSSAVRLLVRYRLPYTSPCTRTGTPMKDVILGWLAGKPKLSGLSARLARRSGFRSAISVPRTPLPVGRGPIVCSSSTLRPTVRNWSRLRASSVSTPSAPYCASTRSRASSMMRRSTTGRLSSASRMMIA